MKINSIKNNFTLKSGYLESYYDPHHSKEKCSAGMCEKNTYSSNIAFNGGLPIKSGAAVNALEAKSKKMRVLNWLLEFVKEHNVSGSALMALFLAGALRPVTIMALPGKKDKDDKIYASAHSMASALIGYGASYAITIPWDNGIKKVMDNYKEHYDTVIGNLRNGTANEPPKLKFKFGILQNKYEKLVELEKQAATSGTKLAKKACKNYIDTLQMEMKNISDWAIAIPRSMLTIALIPPILKYVFGIEKKKAAAKPEQQNVQQNSQPQLSALKASDILNQKSFSQFKGGNN